MCDGMRRIGMRYALWPYRHLLFGRRRCAPTALNLITDESSWKNASLEMLFREKAEPPQGSFKRKTG